MTRRPDDSDGELAQFAVSRFEQTMLLDRARSFTSTTPSAPRSLPWSAAANRGQALDAIPAEAFAA